jgi:HAD superfamily hydrolase (TIGR01509 family)
MSHPHLIKAVFWDVDGTLIDSEDLHQQIFLDLCSEYGLSITSEQARQLRATTFEHKWDFFQNRGGWRIDQADWRKKYNQLYQKSVRRTNERPNVTDTVRCLHKTGTPQACVSNGDREVVEINLALLGLTHCFDFVVANGDYNQGKPHPEPYARACAKLNLKPDNCLAVEDSSVGLESALRAGLITAFWPKDAGDSPTTLRPNFDLRQQGFPWALLAKKTNKIKKSHLHPGCVSQKSGHLPGC